MPHNPPDFILIPVVLGPGKTVDMWLRAASIEAFQPAGGNSMGVRSYVRTKYSTELIPSLEPCSRLLAALRGEQAEIAENIVLFPAGANGPQARFDAPYDPDNNGEPA